MVFFPRDGGKNLAKCALPELVKFSPRVVFFFFFHCGTAGTLVLSPFNIQFFFPLRECGLQEH